MSRWAGLSEGEVRDVGVCEFVVDVEVALGHDLEEAFPVEVDLLELLVFLIVDVGVGEAE